MTDLGGVLAYSQVSDSDSLLRLKLLTGHRHVVSVLVLVVFVAHLLATSAAAASVYTASLATVRTETIDKPVL